MSGWRHALGSVTLRRGRELPGPGAVCWFPLIAEGSYAACGCPTPTPDLTSPCGVGHPHQRGDGGYVPTLCQCGHPIERVSDGR